MRAFALISLSLAISLAFGSMVAYVAMGTLPCRWFGTGFEGACAYGVLWTSIGMGLTAAVVSFAYLVYRVNRRRAPAG